MNLINTRLIVAPHKVFCLVFLATAAVGFEKPLFLLQNFQKCSKQCFPKPCFHTNLLTQTILGRTVKSKRSEKKNEGNLLTDWQYHGCHEPISSFLLVLQRKLLLMCQTSHNQQPEPNWRSVWQSYLFMYLFILFQSLKVPGCKIPTHTHIHELYISLCILISGSRGTRLNNSILCQYIPINVEHWAIQF